MSRVLTLIFGGLSYLTAVEPMLESDGGGVMTPSTESHDRPVRLFLALNAAIYAGMLVACLVRPMELAALLGMRILNPSGLSELMVAFGAIPGVFAAGFIAAYFQPRRRDHMMLVSVALYGGCIVFRVAAAARVGIGDAGAARYGLALDWAMLIAALAICARRPPEW